MTEPMLKVRDVDMLFGGLKAVDNLSIDIPAGTTTALIGPNGAGKTTVFNIITGFLKPQRGTVEFEGEIITGRRPDQIARGGIARSFQDLKLFRGLTCFENVLAATAARHGESITGSMLSRRAIAKETTERGDAVMHWLEIAGLADRRGTLAQDLGYAEAKMLAIARVLALDARLYLLDEPCSGLDQKALERVRALIDGLLEGGATVCIIEHNMALVRDVAEVGIFLEQGAFVASDQIDALLEDERMRERYLGLGGTK